MKVTVANGQSLTDIAIQVYGSAEAVHALASENNISDITAALEAGTELTYTSDNVVNSRVVKYLSDNDIVPVTGSGTNVDNRLFDDTFDLTFN